MCEKGAEKMFPEIMFGMGRITNLFVMIVTIFEVGSEVSLYHIWFERSNLRVEYNNVRSVINCVVLIILGYMKQPATGSGISNGSPKPNNRRLFTELGISRNTEVLGRRRIHSTTFICGKESSSIRSRKSWLSSYDGDGQIQKLESNIKQRNTITNLSQILADPNFLISSWVKIRSNKGSTTPAFDGSMDGITLDWFVETAKGIRKGSFCFSPARRKYVPKPNKKLRPLTMPSPKDKIVQEGMRFLLEMIYEREFKDCSYGFRPKRGCHTALNDIRMKCKGVSWYVKGDINQQFSSIDHTILVNVLKKKIKDQPFIDLVYKYLRAGYGETRLNVTPMKIGLIQGGILSPILANIYMNVFDQWMEDIFISSFNKRKRRRKNPEYWKKYYQSNRKMKDKTIRSVMDKDKNWKRLYFFRYADDFIIGVDGNKVDCLKIKSTISDFLKEDLGLVLNLDKTKITHAETYSARFLGYKIHKTPLSKQAIKRDSLGRMARRSTRPILDAPIKDVVGRLKLRGYVKKNKPTRNAKFINNSLDQIIEHYKSVERGILEYYSLANNYGRLVSRVHFILKFSCVLTIASKMKLRTMKKVFRKYGKFLSVKLKNGETVSYPTPSYCRPRNFKVLKRFDENFIEKLDTRWVRGRKDLKGLCAVCASTENIEIHHVRALRKRGSVIKKDYISVMMSRINRKQIPFCVDCHKKIHQGKYDGKSLRR